MTFGLYRFGENKALMAIKDSKRVVRIYNRVAKALVEFETLWVQAWIRSIESAKAGLQSTLIVRHPTTGKAALCLQCCLLLGDLPQAVLCLSSQTFSVHLPCAV